MSIIGDVVGGLFGGGGGGGGQPAAPAGPDPWDEYRKGRKEMGEAREQDRSGLTARLAASGMKTGSAGWESAFASLEDKYLKKLEDFGKQAVFDPIRGQNPTWLNVAELASYSVVAPQPPRPHMNGSTTICM